jgi:hypothetical protein
LNVRDLLAFCAYVNKVTTAKEVAAKKRTAGAAQNEQSVGDEIVLDGLA